MLVCRVLIGRTCVGDWMMKTYPEGYDSTTDGSKYLSEILHSIFIHIIKQVKWLRGMSNKLCAKGPYYK